MSTNANGAIQCMKHSQDDEPGDTRLRAVFIDVLHERVGRGLAEGLRLADKRRGGEEVVVSVWGKGGVEVVDVIDACEIQDILDPGLPLDEDRRGLAEFLEQRCECRVQPTLGGTIYTNDVGSTLLTGSVRNTTHSKHR